MKELNLTPANEPFQGELLLYADELAEALERSRCFVYAMKAAGFAMPAGLATHIDALMWLALNPDFSTAGYYKDGGVA